MEHVFFNFPVFLPLSIQEKCGANTAGDTTGVTAKLLAGYSIYFLWKCMNIVLFIQVDRTEKQPSIKKRKATNQNFLVSPERKSGMKKKSYRNKNEAPGSKSSVLHEFINFPDIQFIFSADGSQACNENLTGRQRWKAATPFFDSTERTSTKRKSFVHIHNVDNFGFVE